MNLKFTDQNGTALSPEDARTVRSFLQEIRREHGPGWGFVLDLKDSMSQVMRCVYSDTGKSGILPLAAIPLIPDLSWRVTAAEGDQPLYFDNLDLNDPRSFYLRKTVKSQKLALFPIKGDTQIGVLTMFHIRKDQHGLSSGAIRSIQAGCSVLAPILEQLIWRREQDVLNEAMLKIRKRETPFFICQLFNRLLDLPIIFLDHVRDEEYRSVCTFGFEEGSQPELSDFNIPNTKDATFLTCDWGEIAIRGQTEQNTVVTAIFLKPGDHAILTLGAVQLRGRSRDDFDHYLEQVEKLLRTPPYRISTLSFLLHLQHWIRSEDRDITVVIQHIIDSLIPFLEADFGTLSLLNDKNQAMLFESRAGERAGPMLVLPLKLEPDEEPDSILAWVARNNKPFLAADVGKVRFYHLNNPEIRSEMCAPIQVRGELIGMFSVSSRQRDKFAKADLTKLSFFSDQIGIALYQAGILDKAFAENEQARKLAQEINFGYHRATHAKDLDYVFGNLVGNPEGAMGSVFHAIRKINASGRDDLNILITGETGCGKEMVAFALHNSSHRGDRPMVIANFAGFDGDPNLIQSELFGHEKGSFTGASHRRTGCIEQAHGSTLLIDELGDIVSSVQIKLLRVLQQGSVKSFQRLGGQEAIKSDVRILAATHKDLGREVREGRFREDLYYRLKTLVIRIPPLRERLEDIPLLLAHIVAKCRRLQPERRIRWTDGAVKALQTYSWPGNVRQLEAVINRALVLYAEDDVLSDDVLLKSLESESNPDMEREEGPLFDAVREAGEDGFWQLVRDPFRQHDLTRRQLDHLIRDALRSSRGSYKQAARLMGVRERDYNRFLDFLKNSGVKPDFREFR